MSLIQPLGQKILSNVSVIKLKKKGKQFEIAVIPNKVSSWRNGLETDINEVIQSDKIFVNVDQGMLAKTKDVLETLSVKNMEEALIMILKHGKMRLAEKERNILLSNLLKDISSTVASQCVNVSTGRPLTASHVERAMKEIGYNIKINKPAKTQAISVIKLLKSRGYPIARAKMRLLLYCKHSMTDQMVSMLPMTESIDKSDPEYAKVVCQIDPGNIRQLATELAKVFGENTRIDILELHVTEKMKDEERLNDDNEEESEGEEHKE